MEQNILRLLLFYPVFLFSLSFHEAAHGFVANRFGDPTARLLGRVTLNPLPHLDLIGTVFLPIFGLLTGAPIIGWGKPVPVNPLNFDDSRRGTLWVSAFGPLSNIFLALCFAGLAWGLYLGLPHFGAVATAVSLGTTIISTIYRMIGTGVVLNLVLAVFNMIPIPPLDGSGVLQGLLPYRALNRYEALFGRYGMFIILILFVTGALRLVLYPVMALASFLLPV